MPTIAKRRDDPYTDAVIWQSSAMISVSLELRWRGGEQSKLISLVSLIFAFKPELRNSMKTFDFEHLQEYGLSPRWMEWDSKELFKCFKVSSLNPVIALLSKSSSNRFSGRCSGRTVLIMFFDTSRRVILALVLLATFHIEPCSSVRLLFRKMTSISLIFSATSSIFSPVKDTPPGEQSTTAELFAGT